MLFIFVLGSYSKVELLLKVVSMICQSSLAPELCTAWWLGCKCAVRLRGVEPRQVAALSGQLWQWAARCIADHSQDVWRSPVCGGEMLVGSTAGPCPLARCRVVGVKRRYNLLDCHRQSYSFWLSLTNYSLSYQSWLSVLDVSGQTGPSWYTELPSPWCCSWLALLDVGINWSLLMCLLLGVGVEWSQAGSVAFFMQTSCSLTCPAIG